MIAGVGREITGGLPFPFWRKGPNSSTNHRARLGMPSWFWRAAQYSRPPTKSLLYIIFLAVLRDCRCRCLCFSLASNTLLPADDTLLGLQAPWPTHQPPLLDTRISQPIAAETTALEEAEEETEHRAKVRTRNNPRAAIEMLVRAEAVVDAPEEGQEGHPAHTTTTMRNPNPPLNNRSKQRERPWLWYRKQKTATTSRPRSASSAPRQSSTRVSLLATTAPATSAR